MEKGQRITINVRKSQQSMVERVSVKVYQMYDRFCVLDNGKFKFCAFYGDIKSKEIIAM